jgi:hypothetical protein
MKRVSFVLAIALALTASPSAGAPQATTAQGGQTLCRDSKGLTFSPGFLIVGADGINLRCDTSGRWEPVPESRRPQTTVGQGQGQTTTTNAVQATRSTTAALADAGNVRLELVINDQTGSAAPIRKVMTLLVAERAQGRVRSGGEFYRAGTDQAPGGGYIPVTLNADAHVVGISNERVRVSITVEYMPAMSGPEAAHRRNQLNQSVELVLISGKPMLIVESADPISDRKVSLTATATILR